MTTCSMSTCNGKKFKGCTVVAVFLVMVLLAGVIAFLYGTSPKLEVTVTNASITQFNLNTNNNNTLYYSLALDVAIENPSTTFSVHYNRIDVTVKNRQKRVASLTLSLPPFDQGTKNTTILHPVLLWQASSSETDAGIYSIDVQLVFRISGGVFKGIVSKPVGLCTLKVPSNFNETSPASSFKPTHCRV